MRCTHTPRRPAGRPSIVLVALIAAGLAALALTACGGRAAEPGANLKEQSKEEATLEVAKAYAATRDLGRARAELAELGIPNAGQWVIQLVDQAIAEGRPEAEVRSLCVLAQDLGIESPQMVAFLATATPLPNDTPLPTATATATRVPTSTPEPPTATAELPTLTPTPAPTDTTTPAPTDVPVPTATPTRANTPKPKATSTPKPTPAPTKTAAPAWSWYARLVGPGEDAQTCEGGLLQVHITVVDAAGNQIPGVWIHDRYLNTYQQTGNIPGWGVGETKFDHYIGGGGSTCLVEAPGGPCITDYTRNMPCNPMPPLEDMFAVGYCNCCEAGASLERCQQLYNEGKCLGPGHYSWRVVYTRGW